MRPDPPDRSQRPSSGARGADPRVQADAPEPSPDDDGVLPFEIDAQQRLWLRAVIPLLQLRSGEVDPSCRVQFAFDQMYVAACERLTRILRGDLADEPGPGA